MDAWVAEFPAMGGRARVVVHGAARPLVASARRRVEELEGRWSRFRASSEVSRLGAAAGRPVLVSDDTLLLVARSREAWRATAGRFDPTVGAALVAAGYDRSFEHVRAGVAEADREPEPAPGLAGVVVDPVVGAVRVPAGVRFDPGGIGKGLAADVVARELVDAGACGALLDLDGDLRAVGRAPGDGAWTIAVEDPFEPGSEIARYTLAEGGAVATSSRLRRAWRRGSRTVHHLVDPATGASLHTGLAAVTVVAGEAWWAEALTKAVFVAGERAGVELLERFGTPGLLVRDDGSVRAVDGSVSEVRAA